MKRLLVLGFCCAAPAVGFGQVYATAQVGYASADFNLGSPYNGVIDDRAMHVGAEVGIGLGRRMGIELGVNKYNSFAGRATPCAPGAVCTNAVIPTGSNDILLYSLALTPHIEVANVELFAEIGYYHAKIDTAIGLADGDFTDDGVLLGGGARWYFREPWSVSLEAMRFDDNIYQIAVGVGWGLRLDRNQRRERSRDSADFDDRRSSLRPDSDLIK